MSSSDLRISSVTSVEKRESRKHFSASACGLGFKKLFLGSLSSTSVTLEKLKSDEDKFFLRRVMDKYRNKILFMNLSFFPFHTFFILSEIPYSRYYKTLLNRSRTKRGFCDVFETILDDFPLRKERKKS